MISFLLYADRIGKIMDYPSNAGLLWNVSGFSKKDTESPVKYSLFNFMYHRIILTV
jgi:hypothetical protein